MSDGLARSAPAPVRATYRLQVRGGLTLDGVVERGWLDLLVGLGVSHLYLSPVLTAVDGSTHGYDVVDHSRVDPAIGGDEAFDRLCRAAHAVGLGVVVDLVPNHMAADPRGNRLWWDLLRNGRASRWAPVFDVDWDGPEPRLAGRVLLPVLERHCGREIEAGRFAPGLRDDGEPVLRHPSIDVPIELGSLAPLLGGLSGLDDLARDAGALDPFTIADPDRRAARARREADLRAGLHRRLTDDEALAARLMDRLRAVCEEPSALDDLLEAQPYRLARWKAGLEDLSYRRFFDVTSLVALRTDLPEVFDLTHVAVRRWVDDGLIDGVRVDHVDGLADPDDYLHRLRELIGDRWLVVEKILEEDEELPDRWPVDGTTGYEAADLIDRLQVSDRGRADLDRLAGRAGAPTDVERVEQESMAQVLDELLGADVNRLVELAVRICERRRRLRDTTRRELRDALVAVLSRFTRYRTYHRPGAAPGTAGDVDAAVVDAVVARVRDEVGDLDGDLVDLIRRMLGGGGSIEGDEAEFVVRFQQISGPARAKGCEDTAWYRLVSLISRSEVGADPDEWGVTLERFHRAMQRRRDRWPRAMTAATTHDSKRSADVRTRIGLLSQWPEPFVALVEEWWERTGTGPVPPTDLHVLQTLVGAPTLDEERLRTHVLKALREAKVVTSWLAPDEAVEAAMTDRAAAMLGDPWLSGRLAELRADLAPAATAAILGHTLLSLTVPGIPDLYQGSETWDDRLVDPDNRSPVDPSAIAAALVGLGDPGPALPVAPTHVSAKVALVRAALELRRRLPDAFGPDGTYEPLWGVGPRADHVVAFVRGGIVAVVVPRLVGGVADGWASTALGLPPGRWVNRCTGAEVAIPDVITIGGDVAALDPLLGSWPVALLERIP